MKLFVANKLCGKTEELLDMISQGIAAKLPVAILVFNLKIRIEQIAPAELATQIDDDTPERYREDLLPLVSLMLARSVNLNCVKIMLIIEIFKLNNIFDRLEFGGTYEEPLDHEAITTMLSEHHCPALGASDIRLFQKAIAETADPKKSLFEKNNAMTIIRRLSSADY